MASDPTRKGKKSSNPAITRIARIIITKFWKKRFIHTNIIKYIIYRVF